MNRNKVATLHLKFCENLSNQPDESPCQGEHAEPIILHLRRSFIAPKRTSSTTWHHKKGPAANGRGQVEESAARAAGGYDCSSRSSSAISMRASRGADVFVPSRTRLRYSFQTPSMSAIFVGAPRPSTLYMRSRVHRRRCSFVGMIVVMASCGCAARAAGG